MENGHVKSGSQPEIEQNSPSDNNTNNSQAKMLMVESRSTTARDYSSSMITSGSGFRSWFCPCFQPSTSSDFDDHFIITTNENASKFDCGGQIEAAQVVHSNVANNNTILNGTNNIKLSPQTNNNNNNNKINNNNNNMSHVYYSNGAGQSVMPPTNQQNSNNKNPVFKSPRLDPKRANAHADGLDQRILSQYDVFDAIGQGSFSKVYRIKHKASTQLYAMKITRLNLKKPPATTNCGTKPALDNELTILSRLNHPNIVRLYEVFKSKHHVHMVMQIAIGGELYELVVGRGRLSESDSLRFTRQILTGIVYLHSVGVTHRDLKPENILLTAKDSDQAQVLISDFGLAHQADICSAEEPLMTDTCGTPEYIAPEVLMRFPYTNKVDMWAVGVICYILLSGLMPFDDPNRTRLYRFIIRGQYYFYPDYWNTVSPPAREFVSLLLITEPYDRPTAYEALQHPWIAANSQSQQAPPPPNIPRRVYDFGPSAGGMSDSDSMVSMATTHRTRSMRSVARSDHRQLNPKEVAKLVDADPEIRALVYDRAKRRWCRRPRGPQSDFGAPTKITKKLMSSNDMEQGAKSNTMKHYGVL